MQGTLGLSPPITIRRNFDLPQTVFSVRVAARWRFIASPLVVGSKPAIVVPSTLLSQRFYEDSVSTKTHNTMNTNNFRSRLQRKSLLRLFDVRFLDRALPHLADGLKAGSASYRLRHGRVGLKANSKYTKICSHGGRTFLVNFLQHSEAA